jgi:Antitoxin FitA-like, ribbon-helix-helix
VDVNVKNIPAEVLQRLTEQAEAENMSQQEWIRQLLARAAGRLSPAELLRQRTTLSPMSEAEFKEAVSKVTTHRQASTKRLRASQRRS